MSTPLQGFRLSPQQRRVWRLQADSRAFRSQAALLLEGPLRPDALRGALEQAILRHDILRTTFRRSPGIRFPIQVVREDASLHWQTADLAGLPAAEQPRRLDELFRQAARRPFDLEQGPLVHASLVALGPERHALLLGAPALCADRRSLDNLVRDLGAAYEGNVDGEEPVQYVQFSEWQNELLEGEESRSGLDFWKSQNLSAVSGLKLPAGAGVGISGSGAFTPESVEIELGEENASRLREREEQAASLLLAAWLILLWRLGGRDGAGCGVVLDGREHEELRDAAGLFARCLPVSCPLSGEMTFSAAVAGLVASLAEVGDYQDFYAAEELEGLAAGFPALFELSERGEVVRAGGVSFSPLRQSAFVERFKIALSAWRQAGVSGALGAEILYDAKAVNAGFAAGLAGRYRRLLGALLASPEDAIGTAEILDEAERRHLLEEINQTAAELPGDCLHHLVARQAAHTPERVAVELAERRLTYADLDAQANRLAHHLIAEGVGPDRRVGLFLERSLEMPVAVLGVLKAGGAYLPLDPAYPPERLAFMAADARLEIVLSQESLVQRMAIPEAKIFRLDADQDQWAERPATDPSVPVAPDHLAYVIYTSGSTGTPKGVMIHHRGLVNYLSWAVAAYGVGDGGSAPVHSPLGFDLTVTSLFAPLLAGGTVVLLPEERSVEALAESLGGHAGFRLLKLTPAHLALLVQQMAGTDLNGVADTLILGGEALFGESVALWRERAPATRVINEYGPTETVVGCTVYEVPAGAGLRGAVPIGKPIANTEVYVLDPDLGPVPPGVPGELYVGGLGVARGYLDRPDLTAERIVPHPFSAAPGARLYRTGDQARILPDGNLEFLGRIDLQVKVRGYRIELGEIEAVLESHPAVRQAAVLAREDVPGDRRLVAYLVADGESAPNVDELRRFLAGKLPDYMIPSAFLLMSALPLTANGKVARAVLPAPTAARPDLEKEYVAPRTPLEEDLAAVWQQVLGIEKVGVHDSFFALGGDSIRSVRVVALLKERGIDITVDQLFRHQTVAEMAGQVAPPLPQDDPDLARLVNELEGLSDEEVERRLQRQLAGAEDRT